MKHILLPILVCCGALLPFSQVRAAEPKTFGGFTAKQKFSFKVDIAASLKTVGLKVSKAPIPDGIPKFKVGQKVTFTIGSKGELTGPGFSIPFFKKGTSATANGYTNVTPGYTKSPIVAIVLKDSVNGAPAHVNIIFSKYSVKGTTVTTNSVTYDFE